MAEVETRVKALEEALEASEAARISAVSIKLPPFWPDKTRLWFAQAEAQFLLKHITEQRTKFAHVLSMLDSRTAEQAMDIIGAPGNNAYDDLKARLTGAFAISDDEKAGRLLDMTGLGDKTPSQCLSAMLLLVPDGQTPGFLFRKLFLRQLPAEVQTHLAQTTKTGVEDKDLRELAIEADRFFESLGSRVSSVSETLHEATDTNAVSSRRRLCWFHARFGAKALKCLPPCDWKPSPKTPTTSPNQGNSQGGRNPSN